MNKRGKIIFSVLFLFIILISFSLYFVLATEGNTKIYDSETQTATIKNGATDIATIKLDTPHVYNVIRGKDRLVAEFTIDNYADASNVFSNMEFYDLRDNSKEISREFIYKYKTITGQREIPHYRQECTVNGEFPNNITTCNQILEGSSYEDIIKWDVFDDQSMLPSGNITIGIFINVYPNENIEWIPTLYGVKINEWAEWTEGLSAGLVHYWNLNETSGTIGADQRGGDLPEVPQTNVTLYTGMVFQTGKIGNAINFTTPQNMNGANVSNEIEYDIIMDAAHNISISFWINPKEFASQAILCKGYDPSFFCIRAADNVNDIMFYFKSGGDSNTEILVKTTDDAITPDSWNHIVVVYNGTKDNTQMLIFVNNISKSLTTVLNYVGTNNVSNNNSLQFGSGFLGGSDYYFNGSIDEIAIWNRTLSALEISNLYNNGEGITYSLFPPDTTSPTWKNNKTNASNLTKTGETVYFNITLEDNIAGGYYVFSFDDGIGSFTNSTPVAWATPQEIQITRTITAVKGREIRWRWYFNDSAGNNNETPIWSFIVANSAPIQTNPLLSTLSGKNLSTENLTCYNQSTSDADKEDIVTNIYNWYKNSQPFAVLNLPFESNANDYSGNNNHGTRNGTTFVNGKIGKALSFDGVDDYVNLSRPSSLINLDTTFSVETWVYSDNNTGQHLIFDNCEAYATKGYCLLILDNGFRFHVDGGGAARAIAGGIQTGQWYHVVGTYNNESIKIYVNGELINTTALAGPINKATGAEDIIIGFNSLAGINKFDGKIDEVKVYPYALLAEQIKQRYEETKDGLTSNSKIVNQETSGGDNYMCQVTPNDAEEDGDTLNSSTAEIKWAISFNVTDSYSNISLNNVLISCNQTGFSQLGDTTNPYGPYGFEPGSYSCEFSKTIGATFYYNKTIIFTADMDKTINMSLSESGFLSGEEHTWLESIYNCVVLGDCNLYNLMLEMNQTISKIWEQTKPTDESVITFENITNKIVDSTHNLTIDYTINIPIKAGYSLGAYLPVRVGYWFMNTANTTCYNQGTKPTGVEDPYCQPLITETLGPMGGSINFTVKLHPSLSVGNYSIKRIIDIDPNNVWINYGQEMIGTFMLTESLVDSGIGLQKTGENNPNANNQQQSNSPSSGSSGNGGNSVTNVYNTYVTNGNNITKNISSIETNNKESSVGITGGVIGSLISGGSSIIVTAMLVGLLVVFIICRTIIKLKKK